ncbi:tripartite tricarboxylate transporter TctB family protein [Orrella sp. JC864]|uniref:tripartite tricarboxylate transporter TctB family protein n=1 Tax=Orrella sp. JC864 TaxID=3120298 RepID=UPI00300AB4CA
MQPSKRIIRRELLGAGLVIALGIAVIIGGYSYQVGTLSRMGPGMFPILLGFLLVFLGVLMLISIKALPPDDEEDDTGPPQWRGWGCILAGLIAFMFFGKYGGLAPATFALVFISALGDREHTLRSALLLAVGVTIVGALIFSWGLQLQFPLFRWG